mmetsp:Transcript_12251/g.38830  ORF Transcript_12251/g.38830 Transcript_12251/m.38830 type:complete len:424 (-) Transcript_12251:61-1332(-)
MTSLSSSLSLPLLPILVSLLCMGASVGIMRANVPLVADRTFNVSAHSTRMSFVAVMGSAKAVANLAGGFAADATSAQLVLALGVLVLLPVFNVAAIVTTWTQMVIVTGFFGISQGLRGTSLMLLSLAHFDARHANFAIGIAEACIYGASALATVASGRVGAAFTYRRAPFYLGAIITAVAVLAAAAILVQRYWRTVRPSRTSEEAPLLASPSKVSSPPPASTLATLRVLAVNRSYILVCLTGLLLQAKDAFSIGFWPAYFEEYLSDNHVSNLVALYPLAWGLLQPFAAAAADRYGRRLFVVAGMFLVAASLALITLTPHATTHDTARLVVWYLADILLGIGTALVYPLLQAEAAASTQAEHRGLALGTFRLTRDSGYLVGALTAGALADVIGVESSFITVSVVIAVYAVILAVWFRPNEHPTA